MDKTMMENYDEQPEYEYHYALFETECENLNLPFTGISWWLGWGITSVDQLLEKLGGFTKRWYLVDFDDYLRGNEFNK